MLIGRMTTEDISEVYEIERRSICPPWSQQAFADALTQDTLMLTARDEKTNELLGYIVMYISFEEGEITNVAVSPGKRRRGIGKILMDAFLQQALAAGVRRVVLEVRVSNQPAIGLYRNAGFRELGIRKNFYEQPKEDALIMECQIC